MTYKRFEDLPVWKDAADLAAKMFEWTAQSSFRGKGDLANQIQRATLSISNNIAEGFERGSTNELIQFLYYARGSAGEIRSMLCVMERMTEFEHLKSEISDIKSKCESISRQIRGWTGSLQNSEIKGQRHLNESSKQAFDQKKRHQDFMKKMDDMKQERETKWERERQQRNQGE